MPTASIYYRHDGTLDRLFLDGEHADLDPQSGEDNLATVTRALAGLTAAGCTGWRPADDSLPRIIRQADGRGTIAVKPLHDVMTTATVYVNVRRGGQPYRVAVDGRVALITTKASLTGRPAGQAIDIIDAELTRHGYKRISGFTVDVAPDGDKGGVWVCTAETRPGREWRDEPTLVRITDDTARTLTDMAERLGIPADELANTYLRNTLADVRNRYDRFMEPGYILDHDRITGWLYDGSPKLGD